jgi:Arc/MetJ-type ribon-helix-helix transcriptional regulator
MSISLSRAAQSLLDQELATGYYQSADDLILEAMWLLRDRTDRLESLRQQLRPAIERLDRGEGQLVDMDAIKAEARRQFHSP